MTIDTGQLLSQCAEQFAKVSDEADYHETKYRELLTQSKQIREAALRIVEAQERRREAIQLRWNLRRTAREAAALVAATRLRPAPAAGLALRARQINDERVRELARAWHRSAAPIDRLSSGPGVYALFRAGELIYVGKSTNVAFRLSQHLEDKDFDAASFISLPAHRITEVEALLIRALKPKLNSCVVARAARRLELASS
jgi:predicted GIY-YIG superfamily endonuclease